MKTSRLYLRITDEEKNKIAEIAKSKGITVSSYCIMKALEGHRIDNDIYTDKDKTDIHIRLDSKILKQIDDNARKSLMSRSAYIEETAIRNITVLDGLKEFTREINRLGSNLNQTVMLANQGIMKTIDFGEFNALMKKVISYLIEIKGGNTIASNRKGGGEKREKR